MQDENTYLEETLSSIFKESLDLYQGTLEFSCHNCAQNKFLVGVKHLVWFCHILKCPCIIIVKFQRGSTHSKAGTRWSWAEYEQLPRDSLQSHGTY